MFITIKCFAKARELVNSSVIQLNWKDESKIEINLYDLKQWISSQFLALNLDFLNRCRFSKNNKYIKEQDNILQGDTITIIPPISGG
jgi:molybdopterin converting factor small subunit